MAQQRCSVRGLVARLGALVLLLACLHAPVGVSGQPRRDGPSGTVTLTQDSSAAAVCQDALRERWPVAGEGGAAGGEGEADTQRIPPALLVIMIAITADRVGDDDEPLPDTPFPPRLA